MGRLKYNFRKMKTVRSLTQLVRGIRLAMFVFKKLFVFLQKEVASVLLTL